MSVQSTITFTGKPWQDEDTLRVAFEQHGTPRRVAEVLDVEADRIRHWQSEYDIEAPASEHLEYKTTGDPRPRPMLVDDDYDRREMVSVPALVAVAKYGFETVKESSDVTVVNGVGWDTRPENVSLRDPPQIDPPRRPERNEREAFDPVECPDCETTYWSQNTLDAHTCPQ